MDNRTNSKRVAKNTVFLFLRMLVVICVGLYTSRIVLNTLGVQDFGIYNVVGGIVVLFSFLQSALTNATYRFLAYDMGSGNTFSLGHTFSMSVNAHWILALLIFILCETVGLWFLNNELSFPKGRLEAANIAFQFSVLCFCVNIIKTPYNSAIIAHERMNFYAYTSVLEAVLKLSVAYVLYISPWDKLSVYSFLLFSVSLLLLIWYWLHCKKHFKECTYHVCWDTLLLKRMLGYSGWSMVASMMDVGVAQSAIFFFNSFFGVFANAALGIASQVNAQLIQLINNFKQAYTPQIIKAYARGDKVYFLNIIYSTSKLSYFLLLLVSVPLSLNIDFILKLWLGVVPDGTGLFVLLVVLYSLVDAYSAPLWIAVYATGKLRTHQLLMSGIKVLNIPLAYMLLKSGFEAWTILALKVILNIVCSVVCPLYMVRLINLPFWRYVKLVFVPMLIVSMFSIPIPICLGKIYVDSWMRLFVTSVAFFFIYGVCVMTIGLSHKEKGLLRDFLKIRHHKIRQ